MLNWFIISSCVDHRPLYWIQSKWYRGSTANIQYENESMKILWRCSGHSVIERETSVSTFTKCSVEDFYTDDWVFGVSCNVFDADRKTIYQKHSAVTFCARSFISACRETPPTYICYRLPPVKVPNPAFSFSVSTLSNFSAMWPVDAQRPTHWDVRSSLSSQPREMINDLLFVTEQSSVSLKDRRHKLAWIFENSSPFGSWLRYQCEHQYCKEERILQLYCSTEHCSILSLWVWQGHTDKKCLSYWQI